MNLKSKETHATLYYMYMNALLLNVYRDERIRSKFWYRERKMALELGLHIDQVTEQSLDNSISFYKEV